MKEGEKNHRGAETQRGDKWTERSELNGFLKWKEHIYFENDSSPISLVKGAIFGCGTGSHSPEALSVQVKIGDVIFEHKRRNLGSQSIHFIDLETSCNYCDTIASKILSVSLCLCGEKSESGEPK
jgi:hypothetical protein